MLDRFSTAFLNTYKFGPQRASVPMRLPEAARTARTQFAGGRYALAALMLSVLGLGATVDIKTTQDAEAARGGWSQKQQ